MTKNITFEQYNEFFCADKFNNIIFFSEINEWATEWERERAIIKLDRIHTNRAMVKNKWSTYFVFLRFSVAQLGDFSPICFTCLCKTKVIVWVMFWNQFLWCHRYVLPTMSNNSNHERKIKQAPWIHNKKTIPHETNKVALSSFWIKFYNIHRKNIYTVVFKWK